jgi:23S rRNA (adenine2503-C2)-methyltransferase
MTSDAIADRATRTDLLALSPEELRSRVGAWLEARGEPAYRVDQLENWVYARAARDFTEATTLPAGLRADLGRSFGLTALEAAWTARSADGTVKHLWRLEDGEQIESVLIPAGDRLTLCLSSQAGCALGCRFCATGSFGFRRQLAPDEIVAQYRDSLRFAREEMRRPITNVVFMGMGDPLANAGALFPALDVLHRGFGLGARRITVSTVGLVPGIRELARRPEPFGLAVSLHAPDSELRAELMPVERRYPIPELMRAVREYVERKGRRVSFEYTLIDGVNDTVQLAEQLADMLYGLTCFVNLIPWNPIPGRSWNPSPPGRVAAFEQALHRRGVSAAVRQPRGRDIAAACGQLRLERGTPSA